MTIPTAEERSASLILRKTPEGIDRFAAWLGQIAPMNPGKWRDAAYFNLPVKFLPQSEKGNFVKAALESLRLEGYQISDYNETRASIALNERLLRDPELKHSMQDAALLYNYGKITGKTPLSSAPTIGLYGKDHDPKLAQHEIGVAQIIAAGIAPTHEQLLHDVTTRLAEKLSLTKAPPLGKATEALAQERNDARFRIIDGGRS